MSIYEKLNKVQVELNAPKNLYNKFGEYYYRNCEGILTGLKPLLEKYGLVVLLNDEIKPCGDRVYVCACASLIDVETGESVQNYAYAREEESRPKMTRDQLTGSASSYARKYALNGLLAIDDVKDSDSMDNTQKEEPKKAAAKYKEPDGKTVIDLRKQLYDEAPF